MKHVKDAIILWLLGVIGIVGALLALALIPIWGPILLGKKIYIEIQKAELRNQ